MKLFCILLVTLPLLCHSFPASADEKSLSLEETDTDSVDTEHAETSQDSQISKRSGSFDYVSHLKSGLLSSIGHASASIASGSSGGSSGSGGSYKSHDSGHHGNSVDYDPWSFKKSVLNTIFQAVKAITGGVTALKGQLIKGSGYVISASGGVVANTGDKVTDVGKAIINSAHINSNSYGPSHGHGGGSYQHPFAKFSSLSAASSGGSSGSGGGKPAGHGPVIHTETITAYEIPSGHTSYGAPSKPPTYSSATHQYLPPPSSSYGGGGAPFSTGHAQAFEAPQSSYLPASYGHEVPPSGHHDDFNIYGRHQKLTDAEAKKAAQQLQEILSYLPKGKTEFTASKTVTLDTSGSAQQSGAEHVDLQSYGLPPEIGHLESLSHTESITAAYNANPSDIYRQMEKQKQKQTPEEAYLQKHPEEGYDYQQPQRQPQQWSTNNNNYNSYQTTGSGGGGGSGAGSSALDDLTPIIAALEVAKKTPQNSQTTSVNYAINKNVHKYSPQNQFKYLPPVVQKTTHHFNGGGNYGNAIPSREIATYHTVEYHKAKRNAPQPPQQYRKKRRTAAYMQTMPKRNDFAIEDPIWFNNMLSA